MFPEKLILCLQTSSLTFNYAIVIVIYLERLMYPLLSWCSLQIPSYFYSSIVDTPDTSSVTLVYLLPLNPHD